MLLRRLSEEIWQTIHILLRTEPDPHHSNHVDLECGQCKVTLMINPEIKNAKLNVFINQFESFVSGDY